MPALSAALFVNFLAACHGGRGEPTSVASAESVELGAARWLEVGRSFQGRPIVATTVGHGPRHALIICGIHGNEPEGLAAAEPLIDIARSASATWTTTIVRDLNPDGSASRTRGNARGVDLNRNWPAANYTLRAARDGRQLHGESPLSEPETRAGFDLIERVRPELCIVFHASRTGPFINFDGPAAAFADSFARAASAVGRAWRVRPSMGYPTPGSLGSLLGVDGRVAILTVEFELGDSSRPVREAIAGVAAVLCDGGEAHPKRKVEAATGTPSKRGDRRTGQAGL